MNKKTIDELNDARSLVAGGILLIGSFDQDDMTFLDRVDAANDYLHMEHDEQTVIVGKFGHGAKARQEVGDVAPRRPRVVVW